MASYSPKLLEKKYHNWVKAGLAVLFTREGIEPFVYDEMQHFQKRCLDEICKENGLKSGTKCSSCCTENVVACPTRGICNTNSGKCKYHKDSSTQYIRSGCPSKICNNFKNKIQSVHRYNSPSFKNTQANNWCSNPWEVAKCFMPPDGYKDVTCTAETDFNGINSVIINHTGFQSKVHDDLNDKKDNIFAKARVIGKDVRHSPSLEVDDISLNQYFSDLQLLLSDSGYLNTNTHAQNAKQKLGQLQYDTLVLGKEEVRKVLDDVASAIQDKIRTEIDDQEKEAEKQKHELLKASQTAIDSLKNNEIVSVTELNNALSSALHQIEEKTEQSLNILESKTDDLVKTLETKTEEGVERIKQTVSTADKHIKEDLHNNLRDDLIQHYRKQYSTLSITPLLDGIIDVPLLEIYIPPFPMVSVETDNLKRISMPTREESKMEGFRDKERKMAGETNEVKCKTLSDVFCKNQKRCKNIYITAEPGFGKSSFVKWLVLTWCQARNPSTDLTEYFSDTDLQQMREFEFVLLVLLRETQPEETHVDKMLLNHLISLLGRQSLYTMVDVEEMLSSTKCLIILDGLDEWSSSNDPTALPNRAARDTCSYITTSRAWKMATVSIRSSQIDQHIQIKDLQNICTDQILPKILNIFRNNNCLSSNSLQVTERYFMRRRMNRYTYKLSIEECSFLQMLEEKKIKQFATSPIMLMQMLYLWIFYKTVGDSQCQIYSNIVDALLTRAVEKATVQLLKKYKNTLTSTFSYFDDEAYNCSTYYKLLLDLGNVAFQTLFGSQKESSLVFQKKDLKRHVQTGDIDEFLETVVKVGLLSQEEHMKPRRREYSYSFYHKNIQEYFAALYIQSVPGDQHVSEKIMTRCNTVSSILEMGNVFMFLSGFNPQISCEVLQSLQSTISDNREMIKYRSFRNGYSINYNLSWSVQKMIVTCFEECRSNGHQLSVLETNKNAVQFPLQCVAITKNLRFKYSDLEYIIKYNGSRIKSLFINAFRGRGEGTYLMERLIDAFPGRGEGTYLMEGLIDAFPGRGEGTYLMERLTYSDVECLQYLYVFSYGILPPSLSTLDRLVNLKQIVLFDVNLGEGFVLGPAMKHIESVELKHMSITNTALQVLENTVLTCEHSVTVKLDLVTVKDRTIVKQEKTVKHDTSTVPTLRGERSNHGLKTFDYHLEVITTRTLQEFLYTVEKCQHPVRVTLDFDRLKPYTDPGSNTDDERLHTNDEIDEEGRQRVKEYIRSSCSFTVEEESVEKLTFVTKWKPENSDNGTCGESD